MRDQSDAERSQELSRQEFLSRVLFNSTVESPKERQS